MRTLPSYPVLAVFSLTFTTLLNAARLPVSAGKTQAPQFSLEIRISENVIRTDKEIPLEVVMTPSQALWIGGVYGPPLWTRFCRLDVRDSHGRALEEKPTMDAFRLQSTGGP